MKILVTGAAGFIGFHLVQRLTAVCDNEVVGVDSINDYYDVGLKYARLTACGIDEEKIVRGCEVQSVLSPNYPPNYRFRRLALEETDRLSSLFDEEGFDIVVNLAAQAGVRYSIENPQAYISSNIVGFTNLLECARKHQVKHFIYASSSSVYGGNTKTPFSEDDRVDHPVSVYAATKKANELLANVYSTLYKMPTTGLRFFTVYGPWGRPDMAPMLFSKAIMKGTPIKVFNNGNLSRDFTYIDDIIEGVVRIINRPTQTDNMANDFAEIFNIGCGHPVALMDFIHTLEKEWGKEAVLEYVPMQKGDVYTTYADTTKLKQETGYQPKVGIEEGIRRFVNWYKSYYLIP